MHHYCESCGRDFPIPRSGRRRCLGCVARARAAARHAASDRRAHDRRAVNIRVAVERRQRHDRRHAAVFAEARAAMV
jgi:hypothetical protein